MLTWKNSGEWKWNESLGTFGTIVTISPLTEVKYTKCIDQEKPASIKGRRKKSRGRRESNPRPDPRVTDEMNLRYDSDALGSRFGMVFIGFSLP